MQLIYPPKRNNLNTLNLAKYFGQRGQYVSNINRFDWQKV